MANNDTNGSSEGRWKIIAGVAVGILVMGIVFYSFESGLMVSKVKVPGVELEFAERSGLGSVDKPEAANAPEIKENQSRLENKLAELEQQLAERGADQGGMPADETFPEETLPNGTISNGAISTIAGQWFSPQGLTYIFQQQGSYITIQELNPLLGITAVGEGSVTGQQVNISYSTVVGTAGQATLQLSNDGRTMSGQSRDMLTGIVMNMQLQR